jgi:hypothetical protein
MRKKAVAKVSSKVTPELIDLEIAQTRHKDFSFDREAHAKVAELEAAVVQYHEWCVEWRRLNDSLEEELQRTQFMLMDAQAIIGYLEGKIYNS